MKKTLTLLAAVSMLAANSFSSFATGTTFYVSGSSIYDPCGNVFIPRGLNYSVLDDWSFPGNILGGGELSAQIAQTNANIVRINWWRNYDGGGSGRPSYSIADLDTVISRFARAGIVSIVSLADETGYTDTTMLKDSMFAWWTSPAVVALVNRHEGTMIVNIANEWGSSSALSAYEAIYTEGIRSFRAAGINVPLLIDGADYANNIPAIGAVGPVLEAADPLHNIIMSEHAYWAISSSCDANDTALIRSKLSTLHSYAFPVIIGETANFAPSCDGMHQVANTININQILTDCQQYNMGWLYWEWANDDSVVRQASTDGTFASLTPIGDTIVNNTTYGLQAQSVKTYYMLHGGTCSSTGIVAVNTDITPIQVVSLDFTHQLLQANKDGNVRITDMYGRAVWAGPVTGNTTTDLQSLNLPTGVYVITYYAPATGYYSIKTTL
jgi:mannan endo-1,4-beta-mannosidase